MEVVLFVGAAGTFRKLLGGEAAGYENFIFPREVGLLPGERWWWWRWSGLSLLLKFLILEVLGEALAD